MKQNSQIALAVDTYSSFDDDDDGCDGEYVNYRTINSRAHAGWKWRRSSSTELTSINLSQSAVRCAVAGIIVLTSGFEDMSMDCSRANIQHVS